MNDLNDVEARLVGALHEIAESAPAAETEPRSAHGVHTARVRGSAVAAAIGAAVVAAVISAGLITVSLVKDIGPNDSSVAVYETQAPGRETEAPVPSAELPVRDCQPSPSVSPLAEPLSDLNDDALARGLSDDELTSSLSEEELMAASLRVVDVIDSEYGLHMFGAVKPNDDISGLVVAMVRPWAGSVEELEDAAGVPVTACLVDERSASLAHRDPALDPLTGERRPWSFGEEWWGLTTE